jgi:hypothetical protein
MSGGARQEFLVAEVSYFSAQPFRSIFCAAFQQISDPSAMVI